MTHPRPTRLRPPSPRLLAVLLGLTVAVGLLPGASATARATATARAAPASGDTLSYVVNSAADPATLARVAKATAEADGAVLTTHREIGVTVAHSANPGFGSALRAVPGVRSAGATRTAPLPAEGFGAPEQTAPRSADPVRPRAAGGAPEPMEADQWYLRTLKADRAHAVSTGSDRVTVGIIDSGVDDTHPDLAANFSARQSASCATGVANTAEGAWRPDAEGSDGRFHGTWVAGQIAAARNGIGIAGVAPGVRIASIKATEPGEFLFAEQAVCALVFAAEHGIDITNNSYSLDPWHYNCSDDPDQRAITDAMGRAARYATKKGLLHVAAAGNGDRHLAADEVVDAQSPVDSTPVERTVSPAECPVVPHMLPNVVSVAGVGAEKLKWSSSDYGHGVIDVAAPSGSPHQIPDTPSRNGGILSTWGDGGYHVVPAGTSASTAQTSGVAALLKSHHPDASPAQLRRLLAAQADNPGCPDFYDPDGDGVEDAVCEGDDRDNGFYGRGIVDALDAVTK